MMAKFKFLKTDIEGLILVEPTVFGDARGFFMETYNQREFSENGIDASFVQDNHSKSQKGVLRGLHFQKKNPQGKLVRVVSGEVFDVAVDLNTGRWQGFHLSDENKRQLYIPPGFAHGFLVLSDTAGFVYKCTSFYDPTDEDGLLWNDPDIGIKWPSENVILSEKDEKNRRFRK
jgi:dTDP-4-dehydrorhamnose 3,5-epimerase